MEMLLPKQRLAFVFQSYRSEFLKTNSNVRLLPVATFSFLFALLYLKEWVAAIHECIHLPLPVILNNLKLGYQGCLKQYVLPGKLNVGFLYESSFTGGWLVRLTHSDWRHIVFREFRDWHTDIFGYFIKT